MMRHRIYLHPCLKFQGNLSDLGGAQVTHLAFSTHTHTHTHTHTQNFACSGSSASISLLWEWDHRDCSFELYNLCHVSVNNMKQLIVSHPEYGYCSLLPFFLFFSFFFKVILLFAMHHKTVSIGSLYSSVTVCKMPKYTAKGENPCQTPNRQGRLHQTVVILDLKRLKLRRRVSVSVAAQVSQLCVFHFKTTLLSGSSCCRMHLEENRNIKDSTLKCSFASKEVKEIS